ncbi:PstS family phosphate ABC transporter substrate-binding protein [Halothermothrix orenii]|uniref:Phosphate-binding protein n=1 Tax=Halothermothrix orenii (strain H 168 / OCM 544 / DSM 9562) TaxID=373903 RepID=B8D0G7_HALOH|nr:PstS family phosphate ABC transporter substrate-binding protein [Halothermothrix orenii]ACL70903.1 phosphate binding protein [Halothermothrix orenii H 168]
MNLKKLTVLLLSLVLIVGLAGCGGGGTKQQAYIQIKGSDTEVNLVQHLAEVYMEGSDTKISVTGGGSGTGIAALINKKVDIANASRTMKESEINQAEENGVDPVRIVIAMDGLSVITHEKNPVTELTVEQIGKIFKGEITNWKDVGGPDQEISLYGRQSNSGTFVFFRDHVLKGDYSQNMKRMNGNAQIVEAIKADNAGIGYVGVGYVVDDNGHEIEGVNIVNVSRTENDPAVSPLKAENVKNGSYPLARPLNQYVNGKPEGAVLDFIKFELSEEGQKIAVEEGFYPVSPEYQKLNKKNLDF